MTGWTAPSLIRAVGPLLALTAVALPAPTPVTAQQGSADRAWEVPRTEYGHPDLQGNWSNATLTPFERPSGQGAVMDAQRVAELEGRAESRLEAASRPSDPDRAAPPAGGDGSTGAAGGVGGYNGIYIDRGDHVAVVNGEPRSSLVMQPDDGRVPDITPEARDERAALSAFENQFGEYDHPELRPLGERCIMSFGSTAGPPMVPNGFYNNNYTIVQNRDHVLIHTEMVHDSRIIRFGDGPRLADDVRPWMGDSWGHWEGDTLVVETTNIHPEQRYRGNSSDHMRVIERFTRVGDRTLLYEFTVDDPFVYGEPWGGQIPFRRLDDLLYEYACHEGNYALSNILSGARYQERQEAEEAQSR